ncbi:DUF4931 domain-containing protein [Falsibacillus pallidus]|uniref:DUF4931 domain-containing protein n=1 Tax=Falsibacillus pallidus TaxID=493781 RepID=UPI003D975B92
MEQTHLRFNNGIAMHKPENIRNKETECPFCRREELSGIIDEKGSIILLKNKYPVLEDTFQTVLIETDDCDGDISLYSKQHLHELFSFAINHWLMMEKDPRFKSVLMFKNHGPLSGGTLKHPHMQIVGLEGMDYRRKVSRSDFDGILIETNEGVEWTLSTSPRIGFYEWNVIMQDKGNVSQLADYVQKTIYYILNQYRIKCSSYNLFFYHIRNEIAVKIMPRFVTSPLFVGYSIPQLPINLEETVRDIQSKHC